MKQFTIADLAGLTGIKAHTFRTWEQRHGFFPPQRTKTNLRFYTLNDIGPLLNVVLLKKAGLKISAIAQLDAPALQQKIEELTEPELQKEKAIIKLIIAMFGRATDAFDMILDGCVLAWGVNETINNVIIPFLERVNLLSYSDSSTEVHFAVTSVRRKIILGIEKGASAAVVQKTALLFLPKDEHYDLILLFLDYVLKTKGIKTFYLGTNISLSNLTAAAAEKSPDYLVTYLPPKSRLRYHKYFRAVTQLFPHNCFITAPSDSAAVRKVRAGQFQTVPFKKLEELLHREAALKPEMSF